MTIKPFLRWTIVPAAAFASGVMVAKWMHGGGPDGVARLTEEELYYAPTAPIPLDRVLSESAPTAAIVVAMPEDQVLGNARKEVLLVRLIEVASQYERVVVLINRDEPLAAVKIRDLIVRHVGDAGAVLEQVTFQRGAIDSEWVRDYGPLFGLGSDAGPVLLDNMYRDIRAESRTERTLTELGMVRASEGPARAAVPGPSGSASYLSDYGHFWRRDDDAAALHFNEILYAWRRRFAPLVRTPLQISGGDVAFTEDGRMFTSTRTLEVNGGDERRLRRLAEEYFGADDVTYLRPLPDGMWHIDMFFRIVRPGVVLLGEFSDVIGAGPERLALLHREAAETLEWNRNLIEARLPGVEVVRVPMPPILQPVRRPEGDGTGVPELDAALAANGGRVRPVSSVLYRSYLNSLYLDGTAGRSAVLIPRFSGLEEMEPHVEHAYGRAYPGAEVHFIEADVLAEEFAGIHCVTLAIPEFADPARGR